MKRRRIWAAALAAIVLSGCGSDTLKPLDGWGTDLEKAKAEAKAAGKPLAILYSAPWSDVARKFEKTALMDAKVKAELDRFVRVRLDLDDESKKGKKGKKSKDGEKKNEYGIKWAPSLVLVSPLGEVRKLEKGGYPAGYLAKELKKLGEWKSRNEEGWESDRAAAEEKAATSKKRLAVLYSAAWTEDAVKYEEEGLAGARKALEAEFTLLRLNFATNRKEAKAAGVKAAPTLVLTDREGKKLVVAGRHSAELLTTFVKGFAGYQKIAGWRSDYDAARQEAQDKQPLVVVLDKPVDWNSHQFVRKVLGTGDVAALLESFVRVRIEYDPKSKLAAERNVRAADVPCVLIFYKEDAEYRETRTYKDSTKEILNRLREVRGEEKAPEKAKADG